MTYFSNLIFNIIALSLMIPSLAFANENATNSNNKDTTDCAVHLTRTSSLPEKIQNLTKIIQSLRRSDRESILRVIAQDPSPIEGKEIIINQLLINFGFTKEKERLRVLNRAVKSDVNERLVCIPLFRKLMRTYGSKESVYKTPDFLSTELAQLYSRLTTREQQNVALSIPGNYKLPPWGIEALVQSQVKLGKTPLEAERFIEKKLFHYETFQFYFIKRGTRHIFGFNSPDYFQDYKRVPAVVGYGKYLSDRIAEDISQMKAKNPEELLAYYNPVQESEDISTTDESIDTSEDEEGSDIIKIPHREKLLVQIKNLNAERETLLNLSKESENIHAKTTSGKNQEIYSATISEIQAAKEFNSFFQKISTLIVERNTLLEVFKKILLLKGNILLIGPTGTAKTDLTELILSNIKKHGESSYAEIMFHQETNADEILGNHSMKKALEEDVFERKLSEGVTQKKYVLLDEADKARPKVYPITYGLLNERKLRQAGGKSVQLPVRTIVATANKFTSQLYTESNLSPQEVQPYLDRYDNVFLVPGDIEYIDNAVALANDRPDEKFSLDEEFIDTLQSIIPKIIIPYDIQLSAIWLFHNMKKDVNELEAESFETFTKAMRNREHSAAPYKSSRIFSPRTLRKVLKTYLPTIVLSRWLKNPETEQLVATLDDLNELKLFLTTVGPESDSLEYFKEHSRDMHEESQYVYIERENEIFDNLMDILYDAYDEVMTISKINSLKKISDTFSALQRSKRIMENSSLNIAITSRPQDQVLRELKESIQSRLDVIAAEISNLNTELNDN